MKNLVTLGVNTFPKPKGLVLTSNTFYHEIKNQVTFLYPEHVFAIKLQNNDVLRFNASTKIDKRDWFRWEGELSIQECVNQMNYGSYWKGNEDGPQSTEST